MWCNILCIRIKIMFLYVPWRNKEQTFQMFYRTVVTVVRTMKGMRYHTGTQEWIRGLPCSFFRDNFLKQHLLCILCLVAFIMLYKVSHRSFQQWKWRKKAKKEKSWGASKQSINLPTQKHLFNRKIFSLSKTLEEGGKKPDSHILVLWKKDKVGL